MLQYLKAYKKESVIAPLFKMLEASFELLVPIVMANIIDVGIQNGDKSYIWRMCALMIGLGVLGLVCSLTAQYFAAKAAMGFGTALRKALFGHINSLSYNELDQIGTPTLITRMTSDINQAQTGVNMMLRLFLRSPFIVIGAVMMAFTISAKLTIIFLIAVPLIGLAIYLIMRITVPIYKKVQSILDQIVLHTRENYVGARVVRAFSREKDETEQFNEISGSLKDTQLYAGKISALMNPVTYVMVNIAILCILWFGGWQVQIGSVSQGEIVALVNYMNQILLALVALANLIVAVTRALACAIRINEVFQVNSSMEEGTKEGTKESGKPRVAFDHVTFTYGGAQEASLTDISFSAMPGETIGIIGGTGSAKSSLVNLISRLYDVTTGSIKVGGMDVRSYDMETLRNQVAVVLQKNVLFSGTILENLRWGNKEASKEECIRACQLACADEFIEKMPEGYETYIEQGGSNVSGGQKQRLCIARALLKKPKVLILDDSVVKRNRSKSVKLLAHVYDYVEHKFHKGFCLHWASPMVTVLFLLGSICFLPPKRTIVTMKYLKILIIVQTVISFVKKV